MSSFGMLLNCNVSALFTFYLKDRIASIDLYKDHINSYSYFEDGDEEYIYHLFKNNSYSELNIEKYYHSFDIIYATDFILVKIPKNYYMSSKEWELMKESRYSEFTDFLKTESQKFNNGKNVMLKIITEDQSIIDKIEEYLECRIENKNIYWKPFSKEQEVLNLSKMTDMTTLGIRKNWLEEQIANAHLKFEKDIYLKILDNSWELEAPKQIAIGKGGPNINPYNNIYEKCQQAMIDKYGKKQIMIDIKGKKYPFMCNLIDFTTKLKKIVLKYKLDNWDKIEKCLIRFINDPKGAAQLKYYIEKNNESQLATDYEMYEDEKIEEVKEQNRTNLF